jgi:hypothetical protein
MALGQLTYLQLTNRVLLRLGKPQVASADFAGLASDSWGGLVKDLLNDAQQEVYKEHDWSTLNVPTSNTFTTSSRQYDLSASFATFGRALSLTNQTQNRILTPTTWLDIESIDPGRHNSGSPLRYAISYPYLYFDMQPSASDTYCFTYFQRPTSLSAVGDKSILPEYCDTVLVWWVYWQLQASREDAQDGGEGARGIYQATLARAIGQDRRRVDITMQLQPTFGKQAFLAVPFPSHYPQVYP